MGATCGGGWIERDWAEWLGNPHITAEIDPEDVAFECTRHFATTIKLSMRRPHCHIAIWQARIEFARFSIDDGQMKATATVKS